MVRQGTPSRRDSWPHPGRPRVYWPRADVPFAACALLDCSFSTSNGSSIPGEHHDRYTQAQVQHHLGGRPHDRAAAHVGDVSPQEVPRPDAEAGQGSRRRRRLGSRPRRAGDGDRPGDERGRVGQALRGQQLVRHDLRVDATRRLRRQGPARRAGHRRRRRRGALPVPAHDGRVHGAAGRRLSSGGNRCLQPVDVGGVLGRRPHPADRPLPDPGSRHRELDRPSRGGQEARSQGHHHLGAAVGQRGPVDRLRSILGGGRGSRASRPHPRRAQARRGRGGPDHEPQAPRRRPPGRVRRTEPADDGRPRRGVLGHVRQDDLLGHVRSLPRPQHGDGRGGRRLGASLRGAHGRSLVAQPGLVGSDDQGAAQLLLPEQLEGRVHPRDLHRAEPPLVRCREPDVGQRLPAPPPRLALQSPDHRGDDGGCRPRREVQDDLRQRDRDVQARRATLRCALRIRSGRASGTC